MRVTLYVATGGESGGKGVCVGAGRGWGGEGGRFTYERGSDLNRRRGWNYTSGSDVHCQHFLQ